MYIDAGELEEYSPGLRVYGNSMIVEDSSGITWADVWESEMESVGEWSFFYSCLQDCCCEGMPDGEEEFYVLTVNGEEISHGR